MASEHEPVRRKRGGGPRTPEGKRNSSGNSTKHGCCCSKIVLLPGESREELEKVWKTWIDRYHPTIPANFEMVRQAADANWAFIRSEQTFAKYERDLHGKQPDPSLWTAEQLKTFHTFLRYKTTQMNAFHKALRMIEYLVKCDAQYEKELAKVVQESLDHEREPKVVCDARQFLEKQVGTPQYIPTKRTDGGCTFLPCSWEWGIGEHQRREEETDPWKPEPWNDDGESLAK